MVRSPEQVPAALGPERVPQQSGQVRARVRVRVRVRVRAPLPVAGEQGRIPERREPGPECQGLE